MTIPLRSKSTIQNHKMAPTPEKQNIVINIVTIQYMASIRFLELQKGCLDQWLACQWSCNAMQCLDQWLACQWSMHCMPVVMQSPLV